MPLEQMSAAQFRDWWRTINAWFGTPGEERGNNSPRVIPRCKACGWTGTLAAWKNGGRCACG